MERAMVDRMADAVQRSEDDDNTLPSFEVDLHCQAGSRIRMNGEDLPGVIDVTIRKGLEGPPTIVIEFRAYEITGFKD